MKKTVDLSILPPETTMDEIFLFARAFGLTVSFDLVPLDSKSTLKKTTFVVNKDNSLTKKK